MTTPLRITHEEGMKMLAFTYQITPDGQSAVLTRRDLPAIADERHYAVTVTYDELAEILAALDKAQTEAKHHEDRTGGL